MSGDRVDTCHDFGHEHVRPLLHTGHRMSMFKKCKASALGWNVCLHGRVAVLTHSVLSGNGHCCGSVSSDTSQVCSYMMSHMTFLSSDQFKTTGTVLFDPATAPSSVSQTQVTPFPFSVLCMLSVFSGCLSLCRLLF